MATFRLTYFWVSANDEGWTENFYWDGTNLTGAQSMMDSLLPTLADLRMSHFTIIDARCSDVSQRGSVLFTTHQIPYAGSYTPPTGATPLEANTALYVQLLAITPRFMRWNLRGLSSDVITGRTYNKTDPWNARLGIVTDTLIAGQFQARHRVTPPPHATYSYSVISELGNVLPGARKPGRPFGLLVGARRKAK